MSTYYKFLTSEDLSPFQNTPWNLPRDGQPGEWMPRVSGGLSKCQRGYHSIADDQRLLPWVDAHIYELEYRDPPERDRQKCWGAEARLVRRVFADTWTERTARLLACRIAEDVLPIFERLYPDDFRPRQAIEVARLYADGQATEDELGAARGAAVDAVCAAAVDEVCGVAVDAARGASRAAAVDAWGAARGAAVDAVWAAAVDEAGAKYEAWLWETLGVME